MWRQGSFSHPQVEMSEGEREEEEVPETKTEEWLNAEGGWMKRKRDALKSGR